MSRILLDRRIRWDNFRAHGTDLLLVSSLVVIGLAYGLGYRLDWNEEAGQVWIQRMLDTYRHAIWLNPVPERHWQYTPSIQLLKQLMSDRMYPLTLDGLDRGMRELNK